MNFRFILGYNLCFLCLTKISRSMMYHYVFWKMKPIRYQYLFCNLNVVQMRLRNINQKIADLLERLFGSVVDAGCIIWVLVSKIVWEIDFIEIISSSIGHRIRPRSCWHVTVLFFVVTINLWNWEKYIFIYQSTFWNVCFIHFNTARLCSLIVDVMF